MRRVASAEFSTADFSSSDVTTAVMIHQLHESRYDSVMMLWSSVPIAIIPQVKASPIAIIPRAKASSALIISADGIRFYFSSTSWQRDIQAENFVVTTFIDVWLIRILSVTCILWFKRDVRLSIIVIMSIQGSWHKRKIYYRNLQR